MLTSLQFIRHPKYITSTRSLFMLMPARLKDANTCRSPPTLMRPAMLQAAAFAVPETHKDSAATPLQQLHRSTMLMLPLLLLDPAGCCVLLLLSCCQALFLLRTVWCATW